MAARWSDEETLNVRCSPGIYNVDQTLVNGDTDRHCSARWRPIKEAQTEAIDGENRNIIAAGVDGKEPLAPPSKHQRALRAQRVCSCSRTRAASGKAAGKRQRSVRSAGEH